MLHMSQKSYNMEIVLSLIKLDNHIRGLAKELKTNQMMVSRRICELEKENVVDFRQEGKNKVYFLKKSVEAQENVFMAEHYKVLITLKNYPILKNIFQKIKSDDKIGLAVLFGSYAKGLMHKDSDIDIYIETVSQKIKKEVGGINSKINVKIGKYDERNNLIKEIEKNHVVIKDVEGYYKKNGFFR